MSDERLIRDLRALDRPVDVDPTFGDALYATLEGELARRHQFRPRLTLLLVAALLIALLVGGAVAVGSGLLRLPSPDEFIIGPDRLDAGDCRMPTAPGATRVTEFSTDGPPGSVTFAACSFWVGSWLDHWISRIDPWTPWSDETISVGSGRIVHGIASDGNQLWAVVSGSLDEVWRLVRIDPATNSVVHDIVIPSTIGDELIIVDGRAWLSGFGFSRPGVVDLDTGEVVREIAGWDFVEAFGSVWARPLSGAGVMLRIDPRTFEVTTIELPHPEAYLTAASDTGLWATDGSRLYKVSPDGETLISPPIVLTGMVGEAVRATLGGDAYATASTFGGEGGLTRTLHLVRINEETGEIVEELDYPVESWTESISAAGGSIWAGNTELSTLVRYEPGAAE